mgnify:FL=1
MTIYDDLYQFTEYIAPIRLSIHQYLLMTPEPVLIHTGTSGQTEKIIPQLKEILNSIPLKYVLISHFESDECGGLPVLKEHFPEVIAICSEICARQLTGFGYNVKTLIKRGGDTLEGDGFLFSFIDYPSEVHLQNGLLFFEEVRKILFSSDLMFRLGDSHGKILESAWRDEVYNIDMSRVPNEERLKSMKNELLKIDPEFVAVGHGPCVRVS